MVNLLRKSPSRHHPTNLSWLPTSQRHCCVRLTLLEHKKKGNKTAVLVVQIRGGHVSYLFNKGSAETTIDQHMVVAGFGCGGFKLFKKGEEVPQGTVEFQLQNSDQIISMHGVVYTLENVVKAVRTTKVDAMICYHNCIYDEARFA